MAKLLAALVIVVLVATTAAGSALRIDLKKATQAKSPVTYAIRTATDHGLVTVWLELPRKQAALDHLWRIDLVVRKPDKSTLVDVPLQTTLDGDTLKAELLLDPAAMQHTEIWIRTGEHAPLAETIYAIDVGSFK
jgi:hypothetical protein